MVRKNSNKVSFSDKKKEGIEGIKIVSQVFEIPVILIRPFEGQPRGTFVDEDITDLAESIQEIGQQVPAKVRPIKGDPKYKFEFVDGESRWRAIQVAKLTTIQATIEEVDDVEEQFVKSVASNFGRHGHTPIETARAAQRLKKHFAAKYQGNEGETIGRVARVFGHSTSWVTQHLGLLRLDLKVQKFIVEGTLPFQVGVALSSLKPNFQVEYATHIIGSGFDFRRALGYIRSKKDKTTIAPGSRLRRPSDDFYTLRDFLDRLGRDIENVEDMSFAKFQEMFLRRDEGEIYKVQEQIEDLIKGLQEIHQTLEEVREKKNKPALQKA